MATALVLLADRHVQARVMEAFQARACVRLCRTPSELLNAAARLCPDIVVVPLRDVAGARMTELVDALRTGYSSVTIVGYCPRVTPEAARDILACARAGMSDVILQELGDEVPTLRRLLDAAVRDRWASDMAKELTGLVPPAVIPVLRYCAAHARRRLTVDDIAAGMAVHPKTVAYRLRRAGLPSPSTVAGWCRVAAAARMLEDPARSVEQVANELEFASATALRNMLMRYTGLRPRQVREQGGLACVLCALKGVLASGTVRGRTRTVPRCGPAA